MKNFHKIVLFFGLLQLFCFFVVGDVRSQITSNKHSHLTSPFSPLDVSGTWAADSSTGFTLREDHTSCAVNGKIYILGGDDGYNCLSTIQVFDPLSGIWSTPATTGTFTPRSGLTSNVIEGKIYVIGGYDGNKRAYYNIIEIFDPSTNIWSTPSVAGTSTSRAYFASSVVNNKIYVMGGYDGHDFLNSLEVLDPSTNTWSTPTATGTMTARASLTSNVINDKIYAIGGASNNNSVFNTLEIFDPSTNIWSAPATTGTFVARFNGASSVVNGKIYVMGGSDSSDNILSDFQTFDPATNSWNTPVTTGAFTPRSNLSSSVLDNRIYAMGGWDSILLNANEAFTPATDGVKMDTTPLDTKLFPNPTDGILTVYGVPVNALNITIENVLGKTVLEHANPYSPSCTLDLSKLPSGTYFARLTTSSSVIIRKIVRE